MMDTSQPDSLTTFPPWPMSPAQWAFSPGEWALTEVMVMFHGLALFMASIDMTFSYL